MLCAAVLVCSVTLLTFGGDVTAAPSIGAGNAFPVESVNYITDRFQTINPRLDWDNELVDLAGTYTHCKVVDGLVSVTELTRERQSIGGIAETTIGSGTDSGSVDGYIREIVDRWMRSGSYIDQIDYAKRFGCSVRPGCSGRAVVVCLFSPRVDYAHDEPEPRPRPRPDVPSDDRPSDIEEQRALAFTPEQYKIAEKILGTKWDRSHELENLSGYETSCAMIDDHQRWPFTKARLMTTKNYGNRLNGLSESVQNLGSTEVALERILTKFDKIRYAIEVGCSIIPDCIRDREMYVVVSCLYLQ